MNRFVLKEYHGTKFTKIFRGFLADNLSFFLKAQRFFMSNAYPSAMYLENERERSFKTSLSAQYLESQFHFENVNNT